MNDEYLINPNKCCRLAEEKAAQYFNALYEQIKQRTYIKPLMNDINEWKRDHIDSQSLLSFFSRRKETFGSHGYHKYINWLKHTGKLDLYLDRSISYLYLRDLGKTLDNSNTQSRIRKVVERLKNDLLDSRDQTDSFSMVTLYRLALDEGVETSFIWLVDKLKKVMVHVPEEMDKVQVQRKIIKVIAGVLMHVVEEMGTEISNEERMEKLEKGIKLGYSYGLTYPFVDDLFDAKILNSEEEKHYSDMIRTTLLTGTVPAFGEWSEQNVELMRFVHRELQEAFHYINEHLKDEKRNVFSEQSYTFFHYQEVDRIKDLSNPNYTNEDIYIPIILKSSYSRLMVRSVIGASVDEGFEDRTFFYGIYNQLADDFADMYDDLKKGAVTPYTYFLKYHDCRSDLINPFELYWNVIFYLIHNVYRSDTKTCEIILNRAINGLKRYKKRVGTPQYNNVMKIFALNDRTLHTLLQNMVEKAYDVDFFDKLLRDHMITSMKKEQMEQQSFFDTTNHIRNQMNLFLHIRKNEHDSILKDPIIDAANYSLKGDGKRLRPIITWAMGVNEYKLNESAIMPLLKSLEYMHTASLIFDDLPSQDNASFRRGNPTVHEVYNTAVAELTGLFLTQKAIEEQASLDIFDSKTVLQLIQYTARTTADMCIGQAMDLDSRGKTLTLEQLNKVCFYKTGLAFEASLIMPAILAKASETEKQSLKKFAYHAGIAFQIKDDLLDAEGESNNLGKPARKDVENNQSTFVTLLGLDGAKKAMWDHYCLSIETLQKVPRNKAFLKHFVHYIINRDH